jgi:urease accessory protein
MLNMLRLLYMASPALPIGSFAWSHGLAPACNSNMVTDAASLREWLGTVLRYGLGRMDLPLLLRAYKAAGAKDVQGFLYWNSLVFAGRETAELWQEEEEMGKAVKRLLIAQKLMPAWLDGQELLGHVAAFGLLAVQLGGREAMTQKVLAAFAWSWLENQIGVAAKCMSLGQNTAQAILLRFMKDIPQLARLAVHVPDDAIGSSLPGLAIVSSRHEDQPSRMFRS